MSTLKDFEGVDWSEPPRGLIRGVMKRHGLTEREARRRCGLDVRKQDMRPVGELAEGTLFYFNCVVWRLEGAIDAGGYAAVEAMPLVSKYGPENGISALLPRSREVDLNIPEEARQHLPEKEISD